MLLSIGMIVKNEEKYLERCLTALQPVLKAIDSELIIADTGSTDRTVEIAEKFTDNVFHFEWINDFAAARNFTLEKAQGEWFMFIDADEIVHDCTNLINFFKTGYYKNVDAMSVVQRSFTEDNTTSLYSEVRVIRLAKRTPELKLINPIHEILDLPSTVKLVHVNIVLDHFGYAFKGEDGEELAKEKSQRNLELLLDEYDKGLPEDRLMVYAQIADGYMLIDDPDNALKYLKEGLERAGHDKLIAVVFYSKLIDTLWHIKRFDEIIELAEEYFNDELNTFRKQELAADCMIFFARALAYYDRKEFGAATNDLVKFFDMSNRYERGELNTRDLFVISWKRTQDIEKNGYRLLFHCCYFDKQLALANKYAKEIPLEKYYDDHDFMEDHLKIRVGMMGELGYNGLDKLYGQLDEYGKDFLLSVLRKEIPENKPKKSTTLIREMTAIGGIAAELAKIYKGYFEGSPDPKLIGTFLKKHGTANSWDMLYILLDKQLDIAPYLLAEDFDGTFTASVLAEVYQNGIELFENYDIDNISSKGLEKAANLCGRIIIEAVKNERVIVTLFEKYAALGRKWLAAFGGANVPGNVFLALMVNNVVAAKENGDRAQFTKALNDLKSKVPLLGPPADSYAEDVESAFKK